MGEKNMKINNYNSLIIKAFFSVLVYINIFAAGKDKIIVLIFLYSLSICNDFYRKKVLRRNNPEVTWDIRAIASILFSIGIACILKYMAGTYIYIYIILIELLFYDRKQIPANLLGLYGVSYLLTDLGRFLKGGSTEAAWSYVGYDIVYFLAGLFICILILEQIKQKEKFAFLNHQLNEKNELLKQQQQLNEELARSREREAIAQELHDSIGHTLVAVKMYVKVLEKYIAINPEKEKEILSSLNEVIQDSILQLRDTVYRLKENSKYSNLKASLEQLIQSIVQTESQKIYLDCDERIDEVELGLKEDIYKSIREGITNSMKYSNAKHIWIGLTMTDGGLEFSVKDDGVGVDTIHKSYGILGIEERMKKWNGVCTVNSMENNGFSMKVLIKFKQEGRFDDSNNNSR